MKKMEFSDQSVIGEEASKAAMIKSDDSSLPEFVKEVPLSSKAHPNGSETSVDYQWKDSKSKLFRVKRIVFRKGEILGDFYRAAIEDGLDSFCIIHNNVVYIFRKTTRDMAQSLYSSYSKFSSLLINVVGYLRSVLGNDYVISRLDRESWTFDETLSSNSGVSLLSVDSLDKKAKSNLVQKITEKISQLHSFSMILGRFTLNHIVLTRNDLFFTDLRKMRESRQKTFVIDEFKEILQYLFSNGLATRDDIYSSIAIYAGENQANLENWYREKTKKKSTDLFEVVSKLEEEVYS
jgi:hypothetical protein